MTLTRRAAKAFATKPNLRDCGVSIVPGMLVPKTVLGSQARNVRHCPSTAGVATSFRYTSTRPVSNKYDTSVAFLADPR